MERSKLETKRILVYLGVTFALTYGIELLIIRPLILAGNMLGSMLTATVMFLPAIGVLLTRLITREGFRDAWIKPVHFKKRWPFFALAWFAPAICSALGALLYFALFPDKFDPEFGYMVNAMAAAGTPMTAEQVKASALSQILVAATAGPVLNCITCFGEEWGWRGYLLPKLSRKLKILPTLLLSGVIWGVWHAPLTALGHNYGMGYAGFPWLGILAMSFFCIAMGTFFSFVTFKTGCCLPAVIGHGALNSIAGAAAYFTADGGNPFIGPVPTGFIGGAAFILLAIVCALYLLRAERNGTLLPPERQEPAPEPQPVPEA